jgi:hypothetical protein
MGGVPTFLDAVRSRGFRCFRPTRAKLLQIKIKVKLMPKTSVKPKDIAPPSTVGIQGTPSSKLTEAAIEKEEKATATRMRASDIAIN